MIKKFTIILFSILFSLNTQAAQDIDIRYDGIYLNNVTMSQLNMIYQDYKYKDYMYMPDFKYPPIFLNSMPKDFTQISSAKQRNKIFLQIMVPLALKINQELLLQHHEIEELIKEFNERHNLSQTQIQQIEDLASKYNIFTRLDGERRYALILKQLRHKVDIIPPSILIAVAAIESEWGTNRPINQANSLYRELIWHSDEGLEPLDDTDKSYKYKIFPNLYASLESYATKINSSVNYEQFRTLRAQIKSKDIPILGRNIAHTMYFDSNLQNFAGLLDYTITFYELSNIDTAELSELSLPAN